MNFGEVGGYIDEFPIREKHHERSRRLGIEVGIGKSRGKSGPKAGSGAWIFSATLRGADVDGANRIRTLLKGDFRPFRKELILSA